MYPLNTIQCLAASKALEEPVVKRSRLKTQYCLGPEMSWTKTLGEQPLAICSGEQAVCVQTSALNPSKVPSKLSQTLCHSNIHRLRSPEFPHFLLKISDEIHCALRESPSLAFFHSFSSSLSLSPSLAFSSQSPDLKKKSKKFSLVCQALESLHRTHETWSF